MELLKVKGVLTQYTINEDGDIFLDGIQVQAFTDSRYVLLIPLVVEGVSRLYRVKTLLAETFLEGEKGCVRLKDPTKKLHATNIEYGISGAQPRVYGFYIGNKALIGTVKEFLLWIGEEISSSTVSAVYRELKKEVFNYKGYKLLKEEITKSYAKQ